MQPCAGVRHISRRRYCLRPDRSSLTRYAPLETHNEVTLRSRVAFLVAGS